MNERMKHLPTSVSTFRRFSRRPGGSKLSSLQRCFFLLLLASISLPFILFRAQSDSWSWCNSPAQIPVEHVLSKSSNNKCPKHWSNERCQKRREEFWSQLWEMDKAEREMKEAARQVARQDLYRHRQPKQLQKENEEYFRTVQQAVGNGTDSTLQSFSPWTNFSGNSFADLSILGFPKAGTSQLYQVLVTHSDVEAVFKRKEYCIDHGHFLDYTLPHNLDNPKLLHGLKKSLFDYHKHLLNKRTDLGNSLGSRRPLLINACLQPQELEYHAAYAPMPPLSKFIFLFRDPADWLWASWNFWVDKNLDFRPPTDHDWATPGVHYRSPELFHELIQSRESTQSAAKRFRRMRENTVHAPRKVLHLVEKDRILFVKSEDMKASNGRVPQFLHQLSDFTSLSMGGFNQTVAYGQTNCNSEKGFRSTCSDSSASQTSGYAITNFRPMLEETRRLIYLQFSEECKLWAEEFGVFYDECLKAV